MTRLGTGRALNFLWHSALASSSLCICAVIDEATRSHCGVLVGVCVEALTEQCTQGEEDEMGFSACLRRCGVSLSEVRAEMDLLISKCLEKNM